MNKTEELTTKLVQLISEWPDITPPPVWNQAKLIIKLLSDMGCGFKAEKELPFNNHDYCYQEGETCDCGSVYGQAQEDMLEAGFMGFEPIEEKDES